MRAGSGLGPGEVFDRIRERLFAYDVFPPGLIHVVLCPAGPIEEGTTIVQRIVLGPLALEMAVRVTEVWERTDSGTRDAGFTYATVQGHPERGIATFRVRQDGDGHVLVLIDVRSRPGLLLTRMGRPMARLFQRGLTRAGLHRLASG